MPEKNEDRLDEIFKLQKGLSEIMKLAEIVKFGRNCDIWAKL